MSHEEASSDLEVSLNVDGEPTMGENIAICVTVTNRSGGPRDLMVYLDAQLKEYNSSAQQSFWKEQKEVHIQPDDGEAVWKCTVSDTIAAWSYLVVFNFFFF